MRYLHNLTESDMVALSHGDHYRIDKSNRVLRFGLNQFGIPELVENVIGGVEELKTRLRDRKRRENANKRNKAMFRQGSVLDWRAILARRQ